MASKAVLLSTVLLLSACAGNPIAEKIAIQASSDNAAATSLANEIGDQAGAACYPALAPLLKSPPVGPIHAMEIYRGLQMAALGPCAPISAQALLQLLMQLVGLAKAATGIP